MTQHGTRLLGSNNGAVLLATTGLNGRILIADGVDNFTIENVRFYGNKGERAFRLWECSGQRDFAKNVLLKGNGFLVADVTSADALCGTAMEVEGYGYEIRNSKFFGNGFSSGGPDPWADGLTVWNCNNGWIHHNEMWDNTDIDLVVGGGSGCWIENNTITHYGGVYGFAGIHIGWFPPGGGNHQGNIYRWNSVTSNYPDLLSFGIVAGFHPWGLDKPVPHAGSVVENSAVGAVTNLAVDGIDNGEVQANTWGAAQGSKHYPPNCSLPAANYTVFDFGSASLQGGWISRYYHHQSGCGS